uniref:Uncharacterized protein n=1 Tax=Peronospora matthiolae TaxID=2874970 RepID=A0AAV1UWU8_9STRA
MSTVRRFVEWLLSNDHVGKANMEIGDSSSHEIIMDALVGGLLFLQLSAPLARVIPQCIDEDAVDEDNHFQLRWGLYWNVDALSSLPSDVTQGAGPVCIQDGLTACTLNQDPADHFHYGTLC